MFNRREIKAKIISHASPSKAEISKKISEKFSAPEDLIVIESIYGRFGTKEFQIAIKIYSSKEDKEAMEPKLKKKAAAPAEQPAA